MLPSLGGLRAWRFLHHLGRPVLVPESNTRRFLWRLGLVEDGAGRGGRDAAKVMDAVERIARLTGGDLVEVDRLIRWHTRSQTGLAGGGRCSTHPSCEGCAFEAACLWRRFHGATDRVAREGEPGEAEVERIKRRWRELGPEALEDVELLALLLHGGRDGRNPIELAESLLRRFEGLRGVDLGSEAELTDVRGVGESRARAVKVALELGRRASLNPLRPGEAVNGSGDVWRAYRGRYRHIPQEHFITLLLDTKNRLIATHLVSKGTLSASPAHPREVFLEAVRRSASGVILMHNHPTGDPEPSADDLALTRQLVESARILGIRVLDHIILGSETYYSFRDSGLV
jgi:DNA repair protein RadC